MNTPEWLARNVSKLLPSASSKKKTVPTPGENAQSAIRKASIVAAPRSIGERLAGTLRHKEEALSPRQLRRVLAELQAVLDSQLSEVEGGRRAMEFAHWHEAAGAAQRRDCWLLMSEQFAPDPQKVEAAREQYEAAQSTPDAGQTEMDLRRALVSPRTRLLQSFAVFPQGLRFLLDLRSQLLPHLKSEKRLLALDMVPLAKTHRDRIAQLRELVLSGQARNASRTAVIEEVKVEQVRGERLLGIGPTSIH